MENKKTDDFGFWDSWRKKHMKQGYQKFIYDGIVNQKLWDVSNNKICFFLKEAYLKGEDDTANLCTWLNENDLWRMWWVVSDWIYGINNTTSTKIPAFDEELLNKTDLANERIRTASIINIKKSAGEPTSDHDSLLDFAMNDRDLIVRQFEEIKPNIIVCGNTGNYFERVFGYDPNSENSCAEYNGATIDHRIFKYKGYAYANGVTIIDFCHPANRFMRMGKYYALCALYQQSLIEGEIEK